MKKRLLSLFVCLCLGLLFRKITVEKKTSKNSRKYRTYKNSKLCLIKKDST